MKTKPASLLLLGALALTSPAFAGLLGFDHQHLSFTGARLEYSLVSSNAEVVTVVQKAILPATADKPHRFDVTITVDSEGEHCFSLLTLGVQDSRHDTLIVAAPTGPAGAKFVKVTGTTASPLSDPVKGLLIPATGLVPGPQAGTQSGSPPPLPTINGNEVWLIVFTGKECKLLIEPQPDYGWTTEWTKVNVASATSHVTERPH